MKKLFFISVILLFSSIAFAQQYNFRTYNTDDGLPHSQVSAIYQDKKGYLWFTLYGAGVCRFDGKNFVAYGKKEGMNGKLVRPVLQDANGDMWFGTLGDGLWKYSDRFSGKHFEQIKGNGLSGNEKVYSLAQDWNNNLWLGTDSGVYIHDGRNIKRFTEKDGLPRNAVQGLYCDRHGRVWMGIWQEGLYYYEGGQFKNVEDKDSLLKSSVMCVYEDSRDTIWIGTFDGVVRGVWDKNNVLRIEKFADPVTDGTLVYSILDDGKDNRWFATNGNGLLKYNLPSGRSSHITVNNGLPANTVLSLMQDNEKNIWVSCWGHGVARYSGSRFISYSSKEGFPGNTVNSIASDENGDLILSTSPGLVMLQMDGTVSPFMKEFDNKLCYWAASDKKGNLWLSFEDELVKIDGNKKTRFTKKDGIGAFPAHHIVADWKGNLWLSSWSGGVTCYDGEKFINYGPEDGLSSTYIYSVFPDKKGDIWICTWDEGVCRFDGKKFVYFNKTQGLPDNNVIGATEYKRGNILFATYGGGVAWYNGKEFRTISTENGLSDDACTAIVADNSDHVWIATSKGLDRLDAAELVRSGEIVIRHYGREEGFAAMDCARNAVYADKENNLWFGTKRGIYKFDASEDMPNKNQPSTYLSKVQLFFNNVDLRPFSDSISASTGLPAGMKLAYDQNHLTFNFIGISTTVPEKVRYRYMLKGLDKDWSPVTSKTDATYSGIPPGDYTFMVKAANNEGVWNNEPLAFSFTILPPFWQSGWFYTLCGVFVLGGFYTYVKVRTRQLERTRRVLAAKVRERTQVVVKQKQQLEVAYREIEAKNTLVEQKNRDITDSIHYAQRIQKAMLPLEENICKGLPHSFILFRPKDIVSGDFYWYTETEGKVMIAAADCTGHGVPGAFMSMIGNDQLNHIVNERGITDPPQVLHELNKGIKQVLKQTDKEGETRDGMDIALLSFDVKNNTVEFAGANRPLLIIRDNHLVETKPDKAAIGGRTPDGQKFTGHSISLQPADVIYIFTDGYADQFGGKTGKKFMTKNFKELLMRIHEQDAASQKQELDRTIDQWRGDLEQVDDILVIGICVGK